MVEQIQKEGFGACTNYAECEAVCQKEISINFIGRMNQEYPKATLGRVRDPRGDMQAQ